MHTHDDSNAVSMSLDQGRRARQMLHQLNNELLAVRMLASTVDESLAAADSSPSLSDSRLDLDALIQSAERAGLLAQQLLDLLPVPDAQPA